MREDSTPTQLALRLGPNPLGLCMCGCGQPAPLAPFTSRKRGIVKGLPQKYILGHNNRMSPVEYVVQDRGYTSPCWVWQRYRNHLGYGQAWYQGRLTGAHRMIYEREVGPIPTGYDIDHLCRHPDCVNPEHLDPVPTAVNIQRGERAKLTPGMVQNIRALAGSVSALDLARRFGITRRNVYDIINRKTWRNV